MLIGNDNDRCEEVSARDAARSQMFRQRWTLATVFALAAILDLVVVVLILNGVSLSFRMGPLHLRASDVIHALIVGVGIDIALLIMSWQLRWWRRLGLT